MHQHNISLVRPWTPWCTPTVGIELDLHWLSVRAERNACRVRLNSGFLSVYLCILLGLLLPPSSIKLFLFLKSELTTAQAQPKPIDVISSKTIGQQQQQQQRQSVCTVQENRRVHCLPTAQFIARSGGTWIGSCPIPSRLRNQLYKKDKHSFADG